MPRYGPDDRMTPGEREEWDAEAEQRFIDREFGGRQLTINGFDLDLLDGDEGLVWVVTRASDTAEVYRSAWSHTAVAWAVAHSQPESFPGKRAAIYKHLTGQSL